MDLPCRVESGIQVFARLKSAPSLKCLHPQLLPDDPDPGQVIEFVYDSNVPHHTLICELISNTILPFNCGGKNANVGIVITDGHFDITTLISTLKCTIKRKQMYIDDKDLDECVAKCLDKLQIMTVYDSHQFFVTIQSLESILNMNPNMSLILIDTISAFYWSDRMSATGIYKMDLYVRKILRSIQSVTKGYKTVLLYTKPSYFVSKTGPIDVEEYSAEPALEKINHKIMLNRNSENNGSFHVAVTNNRGVFKYNFMIIYGELKWMDN